jgi:FixJ family two-component response regulator
MPGMNGRQLYQQLLAQRPGLKVIFMSGYANSAIAQHGVLDEGMGLLQKPFHIPQLLHKVRTVLGQ